MQLTDHKVLIPPTPATGTDLSKRVVPVLFVLCVTLCLFAVESFFVFYSARCLIVVWILSTVLSTSFRKSFFSLVLYTE